MLRSKSFLLSEVILFSLESSWLWPFVPNQRVFSRELIKQTQFLMTLLSLVCNKIPIWSQTFNGVWGRTVEMMSVGVWQECYEGWEQGTVF